MIVRVVAGLVLVPLALLAVLLSLAFVGVDAVAELLDGDGYCTGDAAKPFVLLAAVLALAAAAGAVVLRGRRTVLAAVATGALVAWIALWAAGGCGIGNDDEDGFDSAKATASLPS